MGEDWKTHQALEGDLAAAIEGVVAMLNRSQLETVTIQSIIEHRRLLDLAEKAHAEMKSPRGQGGGALRDAYVHAMLNNKAQLVVVNLLVDRLGYVPDLPEASD